MTTGAGSPALPAGDGQGGAVMTPLAEFYKNGGGTRHWSCKACHAARKRERFHSMKANDPAAYAAFKRRRRDWQNRHRARAALQRLGLGD